MHQGAVMFNIVQFIFSIKCSSWSRSFARGVDCVVIRCLVQARLAWLADFLMVSDVEFRPGNIYFLEAKKKIQATCRLVGTCSIPLTHIGSLKASMLNTRPQDNWEG